MSRLKWRYASNRLSVADELSYRNKRSKIYCPDCGSSFQGLNADRDYKDHYKKSHGAQTNYLRRKEL